ncbi:hypothetical protein IT157_06325 [bacterium]|nr:hypothetical protein [bacterium]
MRFLAKVVSIVAGLLLAQSMLAQTSFAPGDWTSWRDFRGARSMDAGGHDLFVATAGGILSYDLDRRRWLDPQVMGYGSGQAVPIDDPLLVLYDEETDYLWVATYENLLRYQRGMEKWDIVRAFPWPAGHRPVNIGAGGRSLFVETIPIQVFEEIFAPGNPIPDPLWTQYVTRYSGDRYLGNLMLASPTDPVPTDTRWRGLVTKIPLDHARPPAGFPIIFPPLPFEWMPEGTLYDQRNRAYPITDWLTDRWSYFWTTHWGAGVMRTDLRSGRGELQMTGPAGNDIRAMLLTKDSTWMGGENDGDFEGISVADRDMLEWSYFSRRDDQQIRSTSVNDFAETSTRIFVATSDGLLAYTPKSKSWKRYDVQDGLHSQQVNALVVTHGKLWIGTSDGLAVMDLQTNIITRIPQQGFLLSGIRDLAADGTQIWVGTQGGLASVSVTTHEVSVQALDPGLINLPVVSVSLFGSELWLATEQGVMHRSSNGDTESWLSDVWLKESEPQCILASDPYIWVGTDNGLWRHNVATNEWISYSRSDGLVDNRVYCIEEDGGDLLIGTASGLTRFSWNRPGAAR